MTDLKDGFTSLRRDLDRLDAPEMWGSIEHRIPEGSTVPSEPPAPRVLVIAIALLVAVGGTALAYAAFGRGDTSAAPSPSVEAHVGPPPIGDVPPVTVHEGVTLDLGGEGGVDAAIQAYGSLWVGTITDEGHTEVIRVDPVTGQVEQTFPLVASWGEWGGEGIVSGEDHVWIGGFKNGVATIWRIDPTTNDVRMLELPGRAVSSLAFDEEGRLWAGSFHGSDEGPEIAEIDPSSGDVLSTWPYQAEWAKGVFPLQGTVWTHEMGVSQSTVHGGWLEQIVPGDAPPVEIGGTFTAPVSDGTALWTSFHGDEKSVNLASGIARVDPVTGDVVDEWKVDGIGYDIALGEDGGVWFFGAKGLERLNPSTGETDVHQELPGTPIFITPSPGGLWVGTYEGQMIRFDVVPS